MASIVVGEDTSGTRAPAQPTDLSDDDLDRSRLDLTEVHEVHEVLEAWRRVAWVTSAHGPKVYQDTLASARTRLQSGERDAGAVPWAQLQAELGLAE